MVYNAGSGHCGGSLSAAEIMAVLFFDKLRLDPSDPAWTDRDRFVASKGHCAPILYAALAHRGFFPVEELKGLRQLGHFLQGHPDMKCTPGIDISSGSLGMGLSVGIGMALAGRISGRSYYTYVLLGCGENQEGQIWEAAMSAAKFKLDNLIAIIDYNGVQLDGTLQEVMPLGDISRKWESFGWQTIEIDGHDVSQVGMAIEDAKQRGQPTVIIAETVKGKGVSFMEGDHKWHGKPLNEEEYKAAMAELETDSAEE